MASPGMGHALNPPYQSSQCMAATNTPACTCSYIYLGMCAPLTLFCFHPLLLTELKEDAESMKSYIDSLVIKVLEKCPEVLCVEE